MLALLLTLPSAGARAESPTDCQGKTWRMIETWIGGGGNLEQTVAFLRGEGLAFDSVELADHANEPRVKEYMSQGINPGCSIFVSEWLPLKMSEIKCFPFATRTHEFTSIDFDAKAGFIGVSCSSAIVKMSCEDAKKLIDPGKREPAERAEKPEIRFDGLTLPPHAECDAVQRLN